VVQVTAVIPIHNRADLLARLLATMRVQTVPFQRVIVVDNGSTDGADRVAREWGCEVIALGVNQGFAAAVNRGWASAPDGWVAILNSDVELDSRWLELLLENSEGAGFATGAIFDFTARDRIDGTYDLLSRAACGWRAGSGQTGPVSSVPAPIAITPATACLFRREVLEQLGGFDTGYESYMEDLDLGLKCVGAGIGGIFVPAAKAWHHGSATLGRWNSRVVYLISRNQVRLARRHYDRALLREWLWPLLVGQMLWGLVALRHGQFLPWLKGKRDGVRNFVAEGEPSASLREFFARSEREIRTRATDPYWRWYFRLTSPRRNDT
jgi:GT2 family glycosyltransferase